MDGWIKLYRCTLEKAIWKLPDAQRLVFLTILMLANHEENSWVWQGKKFTCAPGQLITSIDSLSKSAKVSHKSVRTALVNLEKLDFLANESAKTGRLVTVKNWALYQSQEETSAKMSADERQSIGKASATNKNDKNDKNDKKKTYKDFSPEFTEAVENFVAMRKSIKKPMTSRAIELMLTKLDGLAKSEAEKIAILEQSTMHSWQGLYPLKQGEQASTTIPTPLQAWEEVRQRLIVNPQPPITFSCKAITDAVKACGWKLQDTDTDKARFIREYSALVR